LWKTDEEAAVDVEVAGEEADKEATEDTEPDKFLRKVELVVDDEGEVAYPLVVRLGQALATIFHSSSPAERDFSLMNSFLADKSRNSTSLQLLLTKMHIKAEGLSLQRSCQKCKLLSRKASKSTSMRNQEGQHCHCNHWQPPEDLQGMRNGAPSRKYKEDMKKKGEEEAKEKEEKKVRREDDQKKEKEDMKFEVRKMQENNNKRAMEEKRAKKEKEKEKNGSDLFKEKEPSAAEKKRNAQKKRLEF